MKKVLVVEDEQTLLTALKEKLGKEGYEVFGEKNGEEGLNTALKNHPDIILLDILMPVMDGITMLEKLRQDDWGKAVPVIILTNYSGFEKVERDLKSNVDEILIKSDVKLEEIIEKIKQRIIN